MAEVRIDAEWLRMLRSVSSRSGLSVQLLSVEQQTLLEMARAGLVREGLFYERECDQMFFLTARGRRALASASAEKESGHGV